MTTVGVTHLEFDLDGGSCLRLLERAGLIEGCIFGEEELTERLEKDGISKLIFVDTSPKEPLLSIDVAVYDHHQKSEDEEQNKVISNKTAFDILIDAIGTCGLDEEKVNTWRKLVRLCDKGPEPDDMDIARALKRVHEFIGNDNEVYAKWFTPLFDSFFAHKPDLGRAIKILQEAISQFISTKPDSPAKIFLQRWSERIQDREKVSKSSPRNLIHLLSCMEEEMAKEWVGILLEGYHEEQADFQEAKRDFHKAKIDFYGNTLVVSAITKSKQFLRVIRNRIYSKDQDVHPLIREKIKDRSSPWLVLMVNPQRKNFQIFVNGSKKIVQGIITELVKAIRAEVLLKRDRPVNFTTLSEGGTIKGTEPLFFHKLETGYPSILWGSLKHPAVAAIEFGNTSSEIHERLIEIIKLALDENEYPADCNPTACERCSIYTWQLKKCMAKRGV
jgi:hypothetical protein